LVGPISSTPYCEVELNDEKLKAFVYAVKNHYWYQMYLDDLPIWGVVGEITQDASNAYEYFIFTHKKFEIGYNGKQIVDVNLTSENKVKLEPGAVISFTYEVSWKPSGVKFEDRFDKYLDANFFQHRVTIFSHFIFTIYLSIWNCIFRFIGSAFSTVS
jgi:transmembrane 9 superfamily protein 3